MATPDKRGVIRALKKQEKAYRKVLTEVVDIPVLRGFAQGLADASELAVAIESGTISAQSELLKTLNTSGIKKVNAHFVRLSAEHKAEFIKRFTKMVSVDISDLLRDGPIAAALDTKIDENVRLIKLIKDIHLPKVVNAVADGVKEKLQDRPFDRNFLDQYFKGEWKYKDYPLRRIARDQVNKAIGQFNEIRQTQLGIESYIWSAVLDNRVRPRHAENDGKEFYWNSPPPVTGAPGNQIQCRCVAVPVIPDIIAAK